MTTLLALIVVLFPVGIVLRKIFPRLCALCFATSVAWILGLIYTVLYDSSEKIVDTTSLGILMGGSAVGSMYYLSRKFGEEKQLFKLPYLITMFAFTYMVLTKGFAWGVVIGMVALWVIFFTLYFARNNNRFRNSVRKIIECCKNW